MNGSIVAADDATTETAARLLRQGRLVAFPTETVYGLGGDATNGRAVARIFAAKGRPRFNPLIVHVPGLAEAEALATFDERAREAARRFWPGALSLVLRRREACGLSLLVSAGLDTVALRVPAHPLAQSLLRAAGRPIAAPSANRSGRVSSTSADHVAAELARRVALILDGGACPIGLESTVLDLSGDKPVLLRPGGITLESLTETFGAIESAAKADLDKLVKAGTITQEREKAMLDRLDQALKNGKLWGRPGRDKNSAPSAPVSSPSGSASSS